MRITKKWLYIIIGILALVVLALLLNGCAGFGAAAYDTAKVAGLVREEARGIVTELIDKDGDGTPDVEASFQEFEAKAGPVVENAAKSFPYGEAALGILGTILGAIGVTRGRRFIGERILNPKTQKS